SDGRAPAWGGPDRLGVGTALAPAITPLAVPGYTGPISALTFSPDGRLLAVGGADQVVRVLDAFKGNEVRAFRGPQDWVTAVAFSPSGHFFLSARVGRTVKLWGGAGQEVRRSTFRHTRGGGGGAR